MLSAQQALGDHPVVFRPSHDTDRKAGSRGTEGPSLRVAELSLSRQPGAGLGGGPSEGSLAKEEGSSPVPRACFASFPRALAGCGKASSPPLQFCTHRSGAGVLFPPLVLGPALCSCSRGAKQNVELGPLRAVCSGMNAVVGTDTEGRRTAGRYSLWSRCRGKTGPWSQRPWIQILLSRLAVQSWANR